MSKNIVKPRTVSFEEALRNLASRLTGRPAADLPRTQEPIEQYMAENVPVPSAGGVNVGALGEAVTQEVMARIKLDELAEAVTKEVMARIDVEELGEAVTREVTACLVESNGANPAATEPAEGPQDGAEAAGGTSTPPAAEPPQEPAQTATEAPKGKTTRKTTKK